jgi:gluconolactonase
MNTKYYILILAAMVIGLAGCNGQGVSLDDKTKEVLPVVLPGAKVQKLAGGFSFTEGPAADAEGNVFFTDIPNSRIYKWSVDGEKSVFRVNTGRANGLFFDRDGNLLACAGGNGMVVSMNVDKKRSMLVLADKFNGKPFNSPNDLWIHPKGGIYFTDPRYGRRENLPQAGEHVYYISPDASKVVRVIDDLVRPNGIIGTPDGKKLYVADHGGRMTFAYDIKRDRGLKNKKLFAMQGSDGMTIDEEGNIYLTSDAVVVYNRRGEKIATIAVPERPSNVCFGGKDGRTLFITARTSLYSIRMRVKGL